MNGTPQRWRVYVFAWLATFFGFVAVAHGNFETTDAGFTMHSARALWTRGDSGLRRPDQGAELPGEALGALWIHVHEAGGQRSNGAVGTNGLAYPWFPMGHVWLLVPFAAAGDALRAALPAVEQAYRAVEAPGATDAQLLQHEAYLSGSPVLMQGPIALLVPAACIATTALLLFLLARALGAVPRDALLSTSAIVLGTQCFALGRETLSDGPGLTFFVAALLGTVRLCTSGSSARTAVLTGAAAGAAVLLRYQTAFAVIALAIALTIVCRRARRWRDLVLFALGGAPALVLMLAVDHARFGNPFDTGYPKVSQWLEQPIWLGTLKILFAAGRGIMWFSPLLWLALPVAACAREPVRWRWLAWVLFLTPVLFFATANGWQGGSCWSVRYVTPGVVALLAFVLPQAAPWRRWPRTWWLLVTTGVLVNVTSVVAPVRGVIQLAAQAASASGIDGVTDNLLSWHPRYTPLLANWRYAVASCCSDFEDAQQHPRADARAIETVFGVVPREPMQARGPDRWEDRAGRHLWWRFWGELLAVPWWALLLPVAGLAAACALLAVRSAPSRN